MTKYIFLSLLILSNISFAADLPTFPFVVANGKAEREVAPDIANININLLTFAKESSAALDALNLTSKAVFKVLKKYNISEKHIEASDIRKNTQRQRDRNYNQQEILGYETSRTMTVSLNGLNNYPKIMNDLIAIENLSGLNTQFDTKNREKIEKELMRSAGKSARNEANLMALGLDASINSVFAVSQDANFINFFATFKPQQGTMMMAERSGSGSRDFLMLAPEFITLEKSIHVIFKLNP